MSRRITRETKCYAAVEVEASVTLTVAQITDEHHAGLPRGHFGVFDGTLCVDTFGNEDDCIQAIGEGQYDDLAEPTDPNLERVEI